MLESKKKANKKWNTKNLERIALDVKKGRKAEIRGWATQEGMSLSSYIQAACEEKHEKFIKKS